MTERIKFNLAIIGAGPGGYVAAIKAAQMGQSVALIDKNLLGGCCLNVGCIPTKTLLASAHILHEIKQARAFGISVGSVSVDFAEMIRQKNATVSKIRSSLEGLLRANKITIYRGTAQFESPTQLKIIGEDNLFLEADAIIIASGSVPMDIPAFPVDNQRILNSTSLLELQELPKSLAIIGGGYIGCEFASLFAELGSKVTIFEALPSILTPQGKSIAQFMTKSFQERGITLHTNVKVQTIQNKTSHVQISLADGQNFDADFVLVAVGRKLWTEGLSLAKAGLGVNAKGAIETNDRMETSIKGIYAIGDVTGQWMLAHMASHQGIVAASNAAGREMKLETNAVPAVIFTRPEIALVGQTLDEARVLHPQATLSRFPFQALGKAQAERETTGWAEIVSDPQTGEIFGAQVIGNKSSELIAEITLAMQNECTIDSIIHTIHAHPTMSECWMEAAHIAHRTPIHWPPIPGNKP